MSVPDARTVLDPPSNVIAGQPRRAASLTARVMDRLRRTPLWPLLSVAGVGAFQVVAMAFMLLRSKIIAVTLGPNGVGAIALLDQTVIFGSQVCVLGMTSASAKFLAAAHSEGDDTFAHAYSTFLRAVVLLSIVGTCGTALFLRYWVPAVDLMGFAAVAALTIVPLNAVPTIQNAMAASRRVRAAATYGLVTTGVLCCLSAAGAGWYGLRGYYVATLVGQVVVFAGGAWYMRSIWSGARWLENPVTSLRRYRTAVGSAAVLYVSSMTAPLADLVPRYLVTQTQSLEATGLLQAAFGLALAVRNVVRPSFSLFLTPALNRRTPPAEKLTDAASFMRVMLALTTMMALVIVLFPSFWLSVLYTSKFGVVAPWVFLFLFAITVQQVGAVYVAMLFALDELRPFVSIAVGGDLLTCAVTALLVPVIGIPAVAVALIANGLAICVASDRLLRRRYGLNMVRATGPMLPATLTSILVIGWLIPLGHVTAGAAMVRIAIWIATTIVLLAWIRKDSAGMSGRKDG